MSTTRFGKHVSIIYRYSQIFLAPQLARFRLGPGQYSFLMALYDNDGIIQEQLSRLVNLDKTTTARALKKLEEEGYITRTTNEDDKRAQNIFITRKAKEIRPHLEKTLDEWNSIMLCNLGIEDQEYLITLMEKISANILSHYKSGS